MSGRSMDYPIFGMDCPLWDGPDCWFYDTAEEARAAIVKVYGPDAPHIVVRMDRVDVTDPSP